MIKKRSLLIWLLLFFAGILPAAAHAQTITFVGRTEDSANSANATVNVSPPAGIQSGDFILLCVASWNSVPNAPSGFIRLGTAVENSSFDYMTAFYKFYAPGDGLPYIVGASSWPDAVLRAYRGVSGVDASATAGSSGASTKLTLPALSATSASGDDYVGCFANDNQPITLPSDLGHATTQASQWQLGDGDKVIASSGTVPATETATSSSAGNWIGVAATLKAGTAPAPTPTPSSTPTAAPTATPNSSITFIGRTEDSANSANATVNVSPPAGIQSGDFMLLCVASWNSVPNAPSGFIRLGAAVENSSLDYMSAFYKFYSASDALPYIAGASNWPDAVLRAYRGVSGVDASASAGSGDATNLTLPTLAAASASGDEYVGCFANDSQPITLPSDLGHATTQASQWQLGDGDKAIGSAGSVPPAETASSSSAGDWIGVAATLNAGTPLSPTPTPSATTTPPATPAPSATPTPSSSITFIGRTEDSANSASTTVNVSPPAGIQTGDFMLLCVDSWNSVPNAPSGFTRLSTAQNSSLDYMSVFYKFYASGDGLPYIVGASSYPDAVLRTYRGVSGVDASGTAGSSGATTQLTIPALAATGASGDEYIGCFANDIAQAITLPSDLGHATTQISQWPLGDGDKAIGSSGSVPPAETATSASASDWIGQAVTLKAGTPPAPTPTPSATPTPASGCAPVYTGTPQGNDAGFTTSQTIPAATTTQGCYQVAFVETDDPGVNYTGYPSGWTSVYTVGGPEQSEIIIHQNGSNEPANNLWTTAGTISEVYEVNISGICNTSGYDGGIVAYSTFDADSMTIGAPALSSSGVNDLTLAFSNMPWDSIVTMTGASGITGFYTSVASLGGYWYAGIPQSLTVNVRATTLAFSGAGVSFQAAFAPAACASSDGIEALTD
jgi:hypothetical protein